jgi:cupin 2 domain-containing protein
LSDRANLLDDLPAGPEEAERFEELLNRPGVRIERIVSSGQSTPPGEWMVQAWDEWVLLVLGGAGLTIEDDEPMTLKPGDCLLIPAHAPPSRGVDRDAHRVARRASGRPMIKDFTK